ncbi:phospho-N-acetylmuramoyl-pentapeptide-transferase [Lachnoclostridium sp. MSJ-17]|uniref:phospho-N-acetylmuramoyl-pentapeptide- transferase n=1 Tax=Lachnoclostridium sp. MSJ-17 TaxID=2841516 RepID=UPI001C117D62|nr:phospho-N-acetylmuramoyl-pentapeptide-transferase [Lachnoclostridium sp. MSJ-17]MBU5462168.1 phospho-N-acetylmuramoyl-pentapeptide-transferase [Lachnoclostridium sp. MSJ-17]
MLVYGIWTFCAAIAAFLISAVTGKFLIPFLHKLNFGQTILEEGPKWHKSKQGTPIMGGIMFIIAIAAVSVISTVVYMLTGSSFIETYFSDISREVTFIFAGLGLALANGLIGFVDDYTKVVKKRNLGLTAIQKLVLQFAVAGAYLATLGIAGYGTSTIIPFVGSVDLGFFYYIIAAIVIVGVVNAVNLTDGVDGLDGSITFFVAVSFMLIASKLYSLGITAVSAAVAGACLGFLVWNFHPAKVFMGDTGSLFLGGTVCALAFAVNMPILLLPLGIVYLCEMFSVMLQVGYFKLTHGKRLFKMSPIHHHFEMCGWSEVKIVAVFSAVTALFGAGAFLLVLFGV